MKIKSEKGITGIDITVSILIITLFVATITTLLYKVNYNAEVVKRKTEATNKAINLIENLKNEFNSKDEYKNAGDGTIVEGYIDGRTIL